MGRRFLSAARVEVRLSSSRWWLLRLRSATNVAKKIASESVEKGLSICKPVCAGKEAASGCCGVSENGFSSNPNLPIFSIGYRTSFLASDFDFGLCSKQPISNSNSRTPAALKQRGARKMPATPRNCGERFRYSLIRLRPRSAPSKLADVSRSLHPPIPSLL